MNSACSSNISLSIIVPVYREADNIRPFLMRTEAVMERMSLSYEIIFALDPSPDDTEDVILKEIETWIEANVPPTGYISLIADGRAKELYAKYGFVETALSDSVAMARPIVKEGIQ